MSHDDELTMTGAELLAECPPPQRWAWDSADGPMGPGQRLHYERLLDAAGIADGDLPDHVRLALRWVAAGDTIICSALAELLERTRDAAFNEGFDHP